MKKCITFILILPLVFLLHCTLPDDNPEVPIPPPAPEAKLQPPAVTVLYEVYTKNRQPVWSFTVPDYATALRYRLNGAHSWSEVPRDTNNAFITTYTPQTELADGLYSLEVQAGDASGNWSQSGFASVIIDNEPPNAPLVTGPGKTYNRTPSWSWTLPPDASPDYVHYRLYRGTPDNIIIPWTPALEPGSQFTPNEALADKTSYTLEVIVGDPAGNWSNPGLHTIEIDLEYFTPYIRGISPTNNQTPVWTWENPAGTLAVRYRLDNGTWIEPPELVSSFTPAYPLNEGNHILEVRAKNNEGNWSDPGSRIINVDLTPPRPPFVQGVERTGNQKPQWNWSQIPSDGVDLRYRLDNGIWNYTGGTGITLFIPPYNLPEGNHTLDVQTMDAAGNWSESGKWCITIDLTPPSPPDVSGVSPTNDTTPTWYWTIPEGSVNFRYNLNKGTWIQLTGTGTTAYTPSTPLAGGNHTLEVQAQDDAGNWSLPGSATIFIDTSTPLAPIVTGTSPTNNLQPTWNWTVPSGTVDFRYRLNASEWTYTGGTGIRYYKPFTDLKEGLYLLEIQACNKIGNWSLSGSRIIEIDTTPPAAPGVTGVISSPGTIPRWTWNIPSDSVNIRYSLDGEAWFVTGNINTLSYTPAVPLPEGIHTLSVQVQDRAGNWSGTGSAAVFIDLGILPAPVVSVPSITNNTTPAWTWTNPPGVVNIRWRLDGNQWQENGGVVTDSFTPAAPLAEGKHLLELQVQNNTGAWSQTGSAAVVIDITPPAAPVVTGDSPTVNQYPVWFWSSPVEAVCFRYALDGGAWYIINGLETTSFTPGTPLAQGSHTLVVQAGDSAGNYSPSGTRTIIVDGTLLTPPLVTGLASTFNRTPTWNWSIPAGTVNFRYRLNNAAWSITAGDGVTSFTPSSDLAFGTHTLEVQAQNSMGNWSASGTLATAILIPVPAAVTASRGVYNDRVRLSWNRVSGADGYLIFRTTSENGAYAELAATTDPGWDDQMVYSGQTYYYKIRARINSGLTSDYSIPASGYTTVYVPINVTASQGTYTDRIVLDWSNAANYIYHIERAASPTATFVEIGTGSAPPYIDYTVPGNSVFYYRIRAFTPGGAQGSYSTVVSGYRNTLATPQNLSATDSEFEDRIILSWDMVPGAERYYVYRAISGKDNYEEIGANSITLANPTVYEDFTPQPNILYSYKVRAWSAEKEYSAFSNTDQGSLKLTVPLPPLGVIASDGAYSDYIEIGWEPAANSVNYHIYRSTGEQGTYTEIAVTSVPYYKDYAVTTDSQYYYFIKAESAVGGISFPSSIDSGYIALNP